jgi:hypothetical protein
MTHPSPEQAGLKPNRRAARSWWGGNADRGDSVRLEAFSDGAGHRDHPAYPRRPGRAAARRKPGGRHAGPEIGAYAANCLQIGIMWANHHALFRIVERVDQLLLLPNLLLLGFVAFVPLPSRLLALIQPWLTLAVTALLALLFLLGPSLRTASLRDSESP